ncbi:MAG: SUMF1/EgtB/PvdO family nonheme iron enzyme, partial [Planctomycetota bacterium]
MSGGTFTVTNDFKFPDDRGGVHRMYLNDGIMHSWKIQLYYSRDAIIYVGGGILRLDIVTPGSDEYDPAEWLLQGALLAAEGYDEVVIEYVPAGPYTQVRAIRYDPNIAWRPRPADNAIDVAPDANLSWSRGDNASSHDVYVGTNYNDVENATTSSSQYKGNREPNSYEPNSILELGRTYYWRIDEVNDTSETTWKGSVWSFMVDEGKASDPSPGNGEGGIAADVNLYWTPGVLASWHEVYIGTDFNEVSNALDPNIPPGTGRWFTNSYNPPGELDLYTTYYWRVDEGSAKTFVKGDVWSFRVVDTFVNSVGMFFVGVEPGSFVMGSEQGDFDEKPVHNVTISQGFYMSKYEVTNAQYEQFDPDHALVDHRGFSHEPDEAVIFVSWEHANAFCDWLSQQEGQPYRLPTEAEWEFACRAGTTTRYHTGDTLPAEYQKNPGETEGPEPVPLYVGETPTNPWGLCDMHGNVEEWCYDWYGPYDANDQNDPVGRVDGRFKVSRGGSHSTTVDYLRSANRMGTLPEDKHWLIGFRVVMGELPVTEPLPEPPPELYQTDVNQTIPPDINDGPDPNQPYFKGPRTYVKIPPDSYGPLFSDHNHDPALTDCPNGDLLAIWYTCDREQGRELAIAASRLRYGREEWEQASPFWDGPDRNDHAPAMWTDETGRMYHFNGLGDAATWGGLATVLRTSTDNGVTWSRARLIIPEHGLRQMPVESVFRTSGGSIILPCDAALDSDPRGTAIWVSEDNGLTWYDPGGTIAGIHAGVLQLNDGRLMALGRGGNIDDKMPESISTDMGQTWTYSASEFPPVRGGQRAVLRRLHEGPILLVSFTGSDGMVFQDAYGNEQRMYGMFAALSYDEGQSWPVKRLVTAGGPPQHLDGGGNTGSFVMDDTHAEHRGYLAATQTPDG